MAKRRTKTVGELAKALERRELELGLTRDQAIEQIKQLCDDGSLAGGTYYGWLHGVEPGRPFWEPLAKWLGVDTLDVLDMSGILSRARGVYTRSARSMVPAA
jgi:hypothetical protein